MVAVRKPVQMCVGHRTKAEIEERLEQENYLKGNTKISKTPPSHLTKNAKKIYKNIINSLPEDFLNSADIHIVTTCADALDKMEQAQKEISEYGLVVVNSKGDTKQNPAIGIYNRYFTIFEKSMNNLGLSPSARAKIAVTPKEKEKDEFDSLIESLGDM